MGHDAHISFPAERFQPFRATGQVFRNHVQDLLSDPLRFFPGIFDVILGEREGIERKPNPKIVFDILDRCAVRGETTDVVRSEILYVGDSLVDYETAKNANVPFVACSWGFVSRERLVTAEIATIVDTPKDILKLKDVLAII